METAAKEARNAYRREWYRKNREKVQAQQERYWARKAMRASGKERSEQETDE